MTENKTIEQLSELEHEQWMSWSKNVAALLEEILSTITDVKDIPQDEKHKLELLWNKGMKKLVGWRRQWISYDKLDEDAKNLDRRWAMRAYEIVPIRCPVWQCGGTLETVERRPSKDLEDESKGYPGDWQTPDLICNNCGAKYEFKEFKKQEL